MRNRCLRNHGSFNIFRLNVVKETCSISLNVSELGIEGIQVIQNDLEIPVDSYIMHQQDEILQIKLGKSLIPGIHETILKMHFFGTINDKMAGFYRSSYEFNGRRK